MSIRILRLPNVMSVTGLARSTIYLRVQQNKFPKSISLGDRAVGWLESDIEDWLSERVKQSREANDSDYRETN